MPIQMQVLRHFWCFTLAMFKNYYDAKSYPVLMTISFFDYSKILVVANKPVYNHM